MTTQTATVPPAGKPSTDGKDLLLEAGQIYKSFPGVLALDDAWLHVERGTVQAIVGQNGAGKSTLIKILNGAYSRDSGDVILDGESVEFSTTHQAQEAGISTIFQEINLVPFRSVAENIFMGREPKKYGFLNRRKMNNDATEILARLGIGVDVRQPLMNLNVALQQMTAIARAVSFDTKLVIMDEPSSSLDEREVETLFDVIHKLKDDGVSVIYISHRLDELHQIGDGITIMRDGRTVEECALADITKLEIVSKMLGREIGELHEGGTTGFSESKTDIAGNPIVKVENLSRGRAVRDVSFQIRSGEILGLAGLLGSGRTESARMVFGADQPDEGSISISGDDSPIKNPSDAIAHKIGFCSEDRKAEGIIPFMSVRDNLTLAALPVLSRHGVVDRKKQEELVDRFIDLLNIKVADMEQEIRQLSGGNQQKVLLARWLCLDPDVLLLDEPTRGIDVGAKAEIHSLIEELADEGLAVLMITSEMEEIVEGSNHVTVLRDGESVADFTSDQIDEDTIIQVMAEGDTATAPAAEESR